MNDQRRTVQPGKSEGGGEAQFILKYSAEIVHVARVQRESAPPPKEKFNIKLRTV